MKNRLNVMKGASFSNSCKASIAANFLDSLLLFLNYFIKNELRGGVCNVLYIY